MPQVCRKGDTDSGHGCFPSTEAIEGSPDVSINGKPALRVGDALASHGCAVCKPHARKVKKGSASVSINGKPAARVNDAVDCGGNMAVGSGNVNIGDLSWTGQVSLPVKAVAKLLLTNAAGTPGTDRPYPNEPYKLYKDGALEQEGVTDDEGTIEYEYDPPWNSTVKIETLFGEYEFAPQAFQPAETQQGTQQRLEALGYYNTHNDGSSEIDSEQAAGESLITGENISQENEGKSGFDLTSAIKALIP